MAGYVDGFVVPVPKRKLAAYRKLAALGAKVWRDHGALEYCECVGEDLAVKFGVPHTRTIEVKRGETVFFSWIRFKSRAHRDRVNAAVMKDPRLAAMMASKKMPFDCTRMAYGGFEVLVEG